MNFKFGVQRVWFNLCKSGLRAAYRARVYRLEDRRLGSERRILRTHVRSLRPTRVRCGSRTLDQQIFLRLKRNTWALGFGVSNHPVSSTSNEKSVQNCSLDLDCPQASHLCTSPLSRITSDVVAAILIALPLTSVGLNPVALMKFVHGVWHRRCRWFCLLILKIYMGLSGRIAMTIAGCPSETWHPTPSIRASCGCPLLAQSGHGTAAG